MFDERMSDDIFLVKLYYTQSFDIVESLDGVPQSGFLRSGQIDLGEVPGDNHLSAYTEMKAKGAICIVPFSMYSVSLAAGIISWRAS